MARHGPVPTPTALKILKGNPGRRRIDKREPTPLAGIPDAPDWLSAAAKAEWTRVAPQLHQCGMLTMIDRVAFSLYCVLYARWVDAELALQRDGLVQQQRGQKAGHVYAIVNPYVAILNTTIAQLLKILVEFGMTPASRSRIQVDPPAPESDIERFKRRHGEDA